LREPRLLRAARRPFRRQPLRSPERHEHAGYIARWLPVLKKDPRAIA
jgi:hypothetical protein